MRKGSPQVETRGFVMFQNGKFFYGPELPMKKGERVSSGVQGLESFRAESFLFAPSFRRWSLLLSLHVMDSGAVKIRLGVDRPQGAVGREPHQNRE